MCCVGPFKDSDREKLSAQYQDYLNGIEEEDTAATLSANVGTFVANVIGGALAVCTAAVLVSAILYSSLYNLISHQFLFTYKLGESDARQAGLELNPDNVQAMSTDHRNNMQMSNNNRHAISEGMGLPTDILPDGNGISYLAEQLKTFHSVWDRLLPQAEITVNLICQSNATPTVSA